jgi:hypothetical protein
MGTVTAMGTAMMWVMVMTMRHACKEEGKSKGVKGNANGDEGGG